MVQAHRVSCSCPGTRWSLSRRYVSVCRRHDLPYSASDWLSRYHHYLPRETIESVCAEEATNSRAALYFLQCWFRVRRNYRFMTGDSHSWKQSVCLQGHTNVSFFSVFLLCTESEEPGPIVTNDMVLICLLDLILGTTDLVSAALLESLPTDANKSFLSCVYTGTVHRDGGIVYTLSPALLSLSCAFQHSSAQGFEFKYQIIVRSMQL